MDKDQSKLARSILKNSFLKIVNTFLTCFIAIYIGFESNVFIGILSWVILYFIPLWLMINKNPKILELKSGTLDEKIINETYQLIAADQFIINCVIFIILSLFVF